MEQHKLYLIIGLLIGIIIGLLAVVAVSLSNPYAYAQVQGSTRNMTAVTGAAYDKGDYLYVLDEKSQTIAVYDGTRPGDGLLLLGVRNYAEEFKLKDFVNNQKKYVPIKEVPKLIERENKEPK